MSVARAVGPKIAYVCADPGVPVFGRKGSSIHVQEVVRALTRSGAQVELFAMRFDGEPSPDLAHIPRHQLPPVGKGDAAQREKAALGVNDALYRVLAAAGPFDFVYERYSLWSYAGMEFAAATKIPGLLEVNAPLIEEQAQHRSLVNRAGAEEVARRTFGAATALLAVSDDVAAYLESFPAAAGRIHVLPNGVDPNRFTAHTAPARPALPGTFTIGFVGTLKPWHGLDVLLDAFTLLYAHDRGLRLLVVGDGPCRADLTATVAERGLQAVVHFTGAVDPATIPAWLRAMDVAVAPYPKLDNFYFSPLKVYEYMAAGLPVVASRIGQLANLIDTGVNGLLCEPGDAQALAATLAQLRADPALAQQLGKNAQQKIVREHTWDQVAQRILAYGAASLAWKTPPRTAAAENEVRDWADESDEADETESGGVAVTAPDRRRKPAKPETMRTALPGLWRILRRFGPQVRSQWLLLSGALLTTFIGIGLRLLEPWPLKVVVDYLSGEPLARSVPAIFATRLGDLSASTLLGGVALALVLIIVLRAATSYVSTLSLALAGNRVLTAARAELYRHILHLDLGFHTASKSGDLLTHLIGDIGRLQEVAVTAMLPMVVNILTLVGMLGVMFWLNWQLALIALAALPLVSLLMTRFSGRIRTVARQQRKREGALAASAAEALGAMRVVHAFSLEGILEQDFAKNNRKNLKEGVRGTRLAASMERSVDIFIGASTAVVLWYGAQFVLSGALTVGDLVVFLSYLKSAFRPMSDLAKYTARIAKATASGERVLEILETEPSIADTPWARPAPPLRGTLAFEGVSFAYAPARETLTNISFQAEPGQRIAVVGPSGGGKSTLVSLLLRLYDPTQGRILIDGQDIREYTIKSLRAQISVVLQESLLFGVSVCDNIAYGAADVTQAEIEAAARLANAHDFIMAMPDGYATILGERGGTLSGGQRQRLAIARAAVRQAPIVILDEPTVSLDQANEQAVREALDRLVENRTSFLVTHDLQAAVRADLILYIEGGRILERGTHNELLRRAGKYAALYALQSTVETHATQNSEQLGTVGGMQADNPIDHLQRESAYAFVA